MQELVTQRCFRHRRREAAARCRGCRRFYCRECVTEHEGRLLCSACLAVQIRPEKRRQRKLPAFFQLLQFAAGIFVLWFVCYLAGHLLLSIPTEFHEGTVWKQDRRGR